MSNPGSSGPPTSRPTQQTQKPASSSSRHLSYEERLPKIWRNLVSSIVSSFGKAEKTAKQTSKENYKELDEAVVVFLRTRMEWHRLISHVEAKLQGKAEELEALECYVRTQPKVGRKRKRVDSAQPPVVPESTPKVGP